MNKRDIAYICQIVYFLSFSKSTLVLHSVWEQSGGEVSEVD